jgi:site-specific DNA recombinase
METFEMAQEVMEQRRRRFQNKTGVAPNRYPFTGKIECEGCGKNYKRKTTAGKSYWQCATYLQEGRNACHTKQIPEDILHTVTAEALELAVFDGVVFKERIAAIRVPEANRLVFVFRDGHTEEKTWKDKSRSESWDDDMRQAARDRMTPELREASKGRMHEINRKRRKRI